MALTSDASMPMYVARGVRSSDANSRLFSPSAALAIYMKLYLYPATQEVLHGFAVSRARCPKLQRKFGLVLPENRCVYLPI